jgi:hypothetical protein
MDLLKRMLVGTVIDAHGARWSCGRRTNRKCDLRALATKRIIT